MPAFCGLFYARFLYGCVYLYQSENASFVLERKLKISYFQIQFCKNLMKLYPKCLKTVDFSYKIIFSSTFLVESGYFILICENII